MNNVWLQRDHKWEWNAIKCLISCHLHFKLYVSFKLYLSTLLLIIALCFVVFISRLWYFLVIVPDYDWMCWKKGFGECSAKYLVWRTVNFYANGRYCVNRIRLCTLFFLLKWIVPVFRICIYSFLNGNMDLGGHRHGLGCIFRRCRKMYYT